jgi:multidrug efflux pump
MRLPHLCIERPVLSMVISLILLIAGLVSFYELNIRYFPDVFQPSLHVHTTYAGASSTVIEDTLTRPLEQALSSTPDLDFMESQSGPGYSNIQLHFNQISKAEFVMDLSKVEEEVSSVNLPNGVRSPEIDQNNSDGGRVAIIGVTNPNYSVYQLADYAQNNLIPKISRISGVSGVDLWGVESALRISLNPVKMAELNLSAAQVISALESSNSSVASGSLISKDQQISINTNSLLPSIQSFRDLVIGYENGRLIHLSDIATVDFGPDALQAGKFYIDGKPGVALAVGAVVDANPIVVSRDAQNLLKNLQKNLPPGMKTSIVFDVGTPLKESMQEVAFTIVEAIVLVALIIFVFLGSLRAMLIPTVTIPVCLIASCIILLTLHYSINIFTLLACVLAVGLVVDDAIVVLENIYRHIELGLSPMEAARKGSQEIAFAVVGMTVCLIAIYLPSSFIKGRVGSYYQEFAFTLASAVGFSGLLALTLTPMMCSRLLRPHIQKESQEGFKYKYGKKVDLFFEKIKAAYQKSLIFVLGRFRYVLILIFIVLGVVGALVFRTLPSETLPPSKADYITAFGNAPNTASAEYTFGQFDAVMAKIREMPDYQTSIEGAGFPFDSNREAFAWIRMKPYSERKEKDIDVLATQANQYFLAVPALDGGAFSFNLNQQNNQDSMGSLNFDLLGFEDYKTLNAYSERLVQALRKDPLIQNAVNNQAFDNQQYEFSINRSLASQLGIPLSNINETLQTMLNGYTLSSEYEAGGLSYEIIAQLPLKDLGDFKFLQKIFVQSLTGQAYPLSQLVTVKPVVDMYIRNRINQMRAMQIDVTPNPKASLSEVLNHIMAITTQILPPDIQINLSGEARKLQKSNLGLLMAFGLGLIFIYLVLAALFESFLDPLIILLTVPMCMVGALVALKLEGGSFNMYTGIGLVTLIGLVSKHGVLITQFTNELRLHGKEVKMALIQACRIRLRPILMTTSTMVLGALPLLFSTGAGAEGRMQIGWVIVAGLMIGTLFSLFVVPVAYYLLSGLKPQGLKNHDHSSA